MSYGGWLGLTKSQSLRARTYGFQPINSGHVTNAPPKRSLRNLTRVVWVWSGPLLSLTRSHQRTTNGERLINADRALRVEREWKKRRERERERGGGIGVEEMEEEQGNSSSSNLETGKAERSVWLMKCPLAVSKSWQSHSSSESQPVAKVVLSLDPLRSEDPSALEFTMEMTGTGAPNMPKSYSLNMFKDFVPMCVFSETNQGRVAMEGKVEHKFDMKPHNENIEEYGKLCRERTNKSMIKNRQIQVIDNDRGVHMRPMPGMVGLIASNSKDKKKTAPVKGSDMKRTRRDRGELEDIMFKLFERQPNWALKQLVQETDQPAQFLKEILNELCVYNKRGTNQGTYELKPEYKKSAEDTGAE